MRLSELMVGGVTVHEFIATQLERNDRCEIDIERLKQTNALLRNAVAVSCVSLNQSRHALDYERFRMAHNISQANIL